MIYDNEMKIKKKKHTAITNSIGLQKNRVMCYVTTPFFGTSFSAYRPSKMDS